MSFLRLFVSLLVAAVVFCGSSIAAAPATGDPGARKRKPLPGQLRKTDPRHQSLDRKRRQGRGKRKPARRKRPAGVAYSLPVQLTLGDGRVFRGRLRFRAPRTIRVSHVKNGITFTKQLKMPDIRAIKVTRWKAYFLRKAKREKGRMYRFEPSEYEIELKNETRFSRKARLFRFLYHLRVETPEGRTTLFSYWIDLKRPNGSWFTGMQGNDRTVCHRDAVRAIRFHRPGEKIGPGKKK